MTDVCSKCGAPSKASLALASLLEPVPLSFSPNITHLLSTNDTLDAEIPIVRQIIADEEDLMHDLDAHVVHLQSTLAQLAQKRSMIKFWTTYYAWKTTRTTSKSTFPLSYTPEPVPPLPPSFIVLFSIRPYFTGHKKYEPTGGDDSSVKELVAVPVPQMSPSNPSCLQRSSSFSFFFAAGSLNVSVSVHIQPKLSLILIRFSVDLECPWG
ncbi:hypothetical protein C8R45DRAFT_1109871 [Mycena sanguinolenta]|nr:hypothetical protein C8R45DRAFT_1109871 [Mycena sanguinolenta]